MPTWQFTVVSRRRQVSDNRGSMHEGSAYKDVKLKAPFPILRFLHTNIAITDRYTVEPDRPCTDSFKVLPSTS
jgi:hypothetical protein